MTLRALMLDWSIPAPPDVRIASGTFHGFSPCLTWTANAPSFYHAVPDAAFAPTVLNRPAQQAINVDEILTFCYTRIVTLKHVLTLLKPYLYVFLLMQNCEVDI